MAHKVTVNKLHSSDHEKIIIIANWYYNEWGTPIDKTIHRLKNQPSDDTLFQLILTTSNEIIATGGLCNNVNIFNVYPDLKKHKPWLALLYVEKKYRNNGLGEILVKEIAQNAKKNKIEKIYLYTFTAETLYKRCGWKEIQRVDYKNYDTIIMEKYL